MDISTARLKRAKKNFKHENISFQKGDMADLSKFEGRFDYVLNLFTSFGYFQTDKENEKVLRQMVSSLKKEAKL